MKHVSVWIEERTVDIFLERYCKRAKGKSEHFIDTERLLGKRFFPQSKITGWGMIDAHEENKKKKKKKWKNIEGEEINREEDRRYEKFDREVSATMGERE